MAETPVQILPKILKISEISEISDKIENSGQNPCQFRYKRKWAKYIHVKNGLKTVLGPSGAEIIDFLCFDHLYIWSDLDRNFWFVTVVPNNKPEFSKKRNFRYNFGQGFRFQYNFGQGFQTRVLVTVLVIFAKIFGVWNYCISSVKIRNFRCRKFRLSVTPKLQK